MANPVSAIAWFKGSRVCNPGGIPRVVFHGTASSYDRFDREYLCPPGRHATAAAGFYFSTLPSIAGAFAGERWCHASRSWQFQLGANLRPCFLRVRAPIELSAFEFRERFICDGEPLQSFLAAHPSHDGLCIHADPEIAAEFAGTEFGGDTWMTRSADQILSLFAPGAYALRFPRQDQGILCQPVSPGLIGEEHRAIPANDYCALNAA